MKLNASRSFGPSASVTTVLTVYGIETRNHGDVSGFGFRWVTTVLTVYGIETIDNAVIRI